MSQTLIASQPTVRSATISRWLWTLAPILVGVVLPLLATPGIQPEVHPSTTSTFFWGAFSVGLMPLFIAFGVVEAVVALVPSWAKARHAGFASRKRLSVIAFAVALLIATYRAVGYVHLAARSGRLNGNAFVVGAVFVATFAFAIFVAEIATRRGFGNGYITMTVAVFTRTVVGYQQQQGSDLPIWMPAAGLFGFSILTVLALKGWGLPKAAPSARARDAAYRASNDPPQLTIVIPTPASGFVPLWLVTWGSFSLCLLLLQSGPRLGSSFWLGAPRLLYMAALPVILVLTALFARFQNDPARVAIVVARSLGATKDYQIATASARSAVRAATWQSVLFVTAVYTLDDAASLGRYVSELAVISLAVIAFMDMWAEVHFLAAHPNTVSVWPEHRPYAAVAVANALTREGIPVLLRNRYQRTLTQFLGAYIPIDICVPIEQQARASVLAKKCLAPRKKDTQLQMALARIPAGVASPLKLVLATIVGIPVIVVAGCFVLPGYGQAQHSSHRSNVKLEMVLVDDEIDPLNGLDGHDNEVDRKLPKGVTLQLEGLDVSRTKRTVVHFARIIPVDGESSEEALARARPFFEKLTLPAGDHFGFQRLSEYNSAEDRFDEIGYRTVLLRGKAALTEEDVQSARPFAEDNDRGTTWVVDLELTKAGGVLFQKLTHDNVGHRFAIIVDGVVRSAPMVQSEVRGGSAVISMGAGSLANQKRDANALADGLGRSQ